MKQFARKVMLPLSLSLIMIPVMSPLALAVSKVTKVEFINPHSWIHIEVTNADGTKAAWEVEGGTPNTLFRKGINDNTLPTGTPIVVDGYKARDGSNRMSGRNITLADGRQVFLSGSTPP